MKYYERFTLYWCSEFKYGHKNCELVIIFLILVCKTTFEFCREFPFKIFDIWKQGSLIFFREKKGNENDDKWKINENNLSIDKKASLNQIDASCVFQKINGFLQRFSLQKLLHISSSLY